MAFTRRHLLQLAGAASAAAALPAWVRAQTREKKNLIIAVGGKPLFYYLPLSVAELRGYFKDEGLNVEVVDFAGGSKALQAVVGGSADVVSGAFEHPINLQNRGQAYRSFVLQCRAPMIVLGVSNVTMADYQSPEDLKGKKIGVSAPGSSTNMMASFFLAQHGLKASDVSFIGVGVGAGAITALRTGQIDAISNVDPVISTLTHDGSLKVISDTRTLAEARSVFGGNMPAASLYTSQAFIDQNPNTTQALANAIVRADKWIQTASNEDIAALVPPAYLLGDVELYKFALQGNREALSPDGLVAEDGPATALQALAAFSPDLKADTIELSKVWTNDFAVKANQLYPNG